MQHVAQKLNCVIHVICSCSFLLEGKHISSKSVDHWKQFLHQQHVLITLPVILTPRSTRMRLVQPSFSAATETSHQQKTASTDAALLGCHLCIYQIIFRVHRGATVNNLSSGKNKPYFTWWELHQLQPQMRSRLIIEK